MKVKVEELDRPAAWRVLTLCYVKGADKHVDFGRLLVGFGFHAGGKLTC